MTATQNVFRQKLILRVHKSPIPFKYTKGEMPKTQRIKEAKSMARNNVEGVFVFVMINIF